MIFVTVGGQLPFDRMIRAIDEWAGNSGVTEIFAQVGKAVYAPRHIHWTRFLDPREFRRHMQRADTIVAHAGIGSIITALEFRKPILVMPRRANLLEHRNDHQMHCVERFRGRPGIEVALDEAELRAHLGELVELPYPSAADGHGFASGASEELLAALSSFVSSATPS